MNREISLAEICPQILSAEHFLSKNYMQGFFYLNSKVMGFQMNFKVMNSLCVV